MVIGNWDNSSFTHVKLDANKLKMFKLELELIDITLNHTLCIFVMGNELMVYLYNAPPIHHINGILRSVSFFKVMMFLYKCEIISNLLFPAIS